MRKKLTLFISLLTVLCLVLTSIAIAEQIETIEVAYMLTMNAAEERDMVQARLNELLDDRGAGFHVNLVCIDYASWTTQINLMLTDGTIDLFNRFMLPTLTVLVDNGSVMAIDELLDEYGQGIKETLGGYLECNRIGDSIYGTPKVDAYSITQLYFINKSIADEVGIDPEAITDYASLTEALKVVKNAHPELIMIPCNKSGSYTDFVGLDMLGTSSPLGCLVIDDNNLEVVNGYTTDLFKEMLKYGRIWNELGFFMKDPLNAQDGSLSYVSNGQAFGSLGQNATEEIGRSVQEKGNGMPMYVCQIAPHSYAATNNVTNMTWCIPSLSEHKESAMKFLNMLYTDADIANLLCSGIEGVHYVVTDEGNINFANDLNAFTTGWPSGMGTFWPNITITYPWVPDDAETYNAWIESNETSVLSPAMGFVFDSSNVSDEITACTAVVDKYEHSLLLDVGDTQTLYQQFLDELDGAGINEIIAEKQAQLDEWAMHNANAK